jgi:hypothetical protein
MLSQFSLTDPDGVSIVFYPHCKLKDCEIFSGDRATMEDHPAVVFNRVSERRSRARKEAFGCTVLSSG